MSSYSDDLADKAQRLTTALLRTNANEDIRAAREQVVIALARYNMSLEDNVVTFGRPEPPPDEALAKLLKALSEHVMWLSAIGYGYQAGRIGELVHDVKAPR